VAAGTATLIGPLLSSSLGPHWLIGGIVAPCLWYLGVARMLWLHGAGLSQDHLAL
jgi:hypothetical protein